MLLKDVFRDFMDRKTGQLKQSTLRYYAGYYRNWLEQPFSDVSVFDISREGLEDALRTCPPTQRNRIRSFVSSLFKHSEDFCACKGVGNPALGIQQYKENPRKRYVRKDEWKRLSKGLFVLDEGNRNERRFALFIRLILFTGVRKSEAENARFENVDYQRGCILVTGKTGEREVALPPLILDCFKALGRTEGFIFPALKAKDKGRNYSYAWSQFREKHDIPEITRHDLRRTFGVMGLNDGLTLEEIQALLGHSSITTTERSYAWLLTETKKKAASKMETTLKKNLA